MENEKDIYKTSRFMYILEAAFEYFISLMVAGAYLARLTTEIGMSDAMTGIISSLGSLASCFQIAAIFLFANRNVKKPLSILYPIARICFIFLYIIPFLDIPGSVKAVIFIASLFGGRLITNAINSPKINWFMSLVDDNKRGNFTANKEIVSLIGGMVFSYAMGGAVDWLEEAGKHTEAFILCGITIFVLTVLHTVTLLVSKEKNLTVEEKIPIRRLLPEMIRDTTVMKVILVSVLWTVATHITTPFEGTYRIKELGFSMTFISVGSMVYSVIRVLASKPLGKYADRHTFTKMLNFCFAAALIAFLAGAFTVPENGAPLYVLYNVFYGIGMAGINSGNINLIYEHVSKEKRVCALALKDGIVGLVGFGTTLAASRLVEYIQQNGNHLFGIPLYAQQVTSALGAAVIAAILLYLNTAIRRL
ncbi:MAG: MFS transporter [Ruminococcaceae bacterium]|nr:MFS transporter [Oscillospiraceae bacterium]